MADEKLNTGPEEQKTPEAAEPAPAPVPEQAADSTLKQEQAGPVPPAPGEVVVSFDKINELMGEKRRAVLPTSLAQAKKLREQDKEGKLNGDVIDGILSEKKKEDRGVIISTAELEKYFGKEVTPAKMKEQIMTLLDDWKQKQPPELAKAPKSKEKDKKTTSRQLMAN